MCNYKITIVALNIIPDWLPVEIFLRAIKNDLWKSFFSVPYMSKYVFVYDQAAI